MKALHGQHDIRKNTGFVIEAWHPLSEKVVSTCLDATNGPAFPLAGENENIEDGVAYRCSPDRPNEQKPLAENFSNLLGWPLD